MGELITYQQVENALVTLRGQQVLLDVDVARMYGVETREINQAVRNNPDKFPDGYILYTTPEEMQYLRSKFLTANISSKSRVLPKAFTKKGLYMLATILKSPQATATTIAIVETFAKVRELGRIVHELTETKDEFAQKSLMEKGGELMSTLLGPDMAVAEDETEIELNFAVLKLKHTIKRKKK